ncbi:hypothetical protein [Actinomadura harenae]|uniref:hypothetical protein n=1 Tax=Actinomadura harenae TaxID=2483351 RepID=UPI0011C3655B|nr:hypothetical protein [Actinomadura harenae]
MADSSMGPDDAIFYEVTPDYVNDTSTIPWGVSMQATIERSDGTRQLLFSAVLPNDQASSGLNLGN